MEVIQKLLPALAAISFAACSGLIIRLSLSVVGQRWVRTYHHTMSYLLLPVVTFVIVKIISGNIALSLGMIGALSIVRFRNPVKNPFELVMFFVLLTIGIATGVSMKWGALLLFVVLVVIFFVFFLEKIFARYNRDLMSLSFDEGVNANLMVVSSTAELDGLERNVNCQQYFNSKVTGLHTYKLAFRQRNSLQSIHLKLKDDPRIDTIDIRYSS
jgi:uncharacterized membrane protein YhiD involved in acid resistance